MGEMALFKCFLSYDLLWEIFLGIFISLIISHVYRKLLHHAQFKRMQSTCEEYKEVQDRILVLKSFHLWIKSQN